MSKWPMRGHFRYLRFKTFPMTPKTPKCEVFWALLSNSKHLGVPEDSKSPTLGVLGFTPTLGQSGVATECYFVSNFVSRPPLFLTTISCSFLIHFERFQRLQMRYLKIYKTCVKWKVKKYLKSWSFKIILNNYEKIQSTTPFTLKGHILLIFH